MYEKEVDQRKAAEDGTQQGSCTTRKRGRMFKDVRQPLQERAAPGSDSSNPDERALWVRCRCNKVPRCEPCWTTHCDLQPSCYSPFAPESNVMLPYDVYSKSSVYLYEPPLKAGRSGHANQP